jgi:hypothetical protein
MFKNIRNSRLAASGCTQHDGVKRTMDASLILHSRVKSLGFALGVLLNDAPTLTFSAAKD